MFRETQLMLKSFSHLLFGSLTILGTIGSANLAQAAQLLMIPDSLNDSILLFDSYDGALVDDNFIDGAGIFQTPLNAIQVNNEIWVSDQLADSIFRFNLNGKLLSTISGGLDNIRGMAFIDDRVYVTNAGTNNNAPGAGIVTFDTNGNNLGFFATGSPYDVLFYNGELLISNVADENLERYSLNGVFLGTFHDSDGVTGIDFPQQLATRGDSNVLAAGFSNPAGIYEYDSDGSQIGLYTSAEGVANRGIRGVYELGNGNILWTGGDGVVSTNLTVGTPEFGSFTDIYTRQSLGCTSACVSARFIDPLQVPEPGSIFGLLTFGFLGASSFLKGKSYQK